MDKRRTAVSSGHTYTSGNAPLLGLWSWSTRLVSAIVDSAHDAIGMTCWNCRTSVRSLSCNKSLLSPPAVSFSH